LKPTRHYIWPLVLIAAIFTASSQPSIAIPNVGFSYDKIAHFLVFGLLATSILRITQLSKMGWKGIWITVCIVSAYGIVDEFRQLFTEGRSVELGDWIADVSGATLASILYLKWNWYRRILEANYFQKKQVADETQPNPG